jgi:formylmethanofuran dehydrogenase subunit E
MRETTPQPNPKEQVTKTCSKCGAEFTADPLSFAGQRGICPSCFIFDFDLREILVPKKEPKKK